MDTHCPALLAIELAAPAPALLPQLPTEQAAALVDAIAGDLARLLPGVDGLGLAVAGALFDPAQLLRPGWPIFAELALLYSRQRRGDPAPVVAGFGAAGGRMASPVLEPEPGLGGGSFVVVPFVLVGEDALAQRIGARMEEDFHDQGLAGAAVPLFLAQALGLEVAHARYFTHHDLCALTAIQLDHAGLGPAWSLVEAALLSPGRARFVQTEGGAAWRLADGGVRGAAFGFADWVAGPGAGLDTDRRAEGFVETLLMQRRTAALLAAHGLPPTWVAVEPGADAATVETRLAGPPLRPPQVLERLREPAGGARRVCALSDPRLGVAGHAVLESTPTGPRVLARAWPLDQATARAAAAGLAAAFDADPAGDRLPLADALHD
jgi:hypothetical protein